METKPSNRELFIQKAVKAHGTKYDYSQVSYTNTHTKVTIVCPEHGAFGQLPMSHIRGFGCDKCSPRSTRLTQEAVIERIQSIHGTKYDLSKVQFSTINHKITLICPEHGDFDITPKSIFQQQAGCNKCAYKIRGDYSRKSVDQFIIDATAIHGTRYDYSQIQEYKNSNTKLPIVCKDHGVFLQTLNGHIHSKQGCPLCNTGNGRGGYTHSYFQHNPEEQTNPGILYAARFTNGNERFIKIGITAKTTKHRFGRSEYKDMTVEVLYEKPMTIYEAFCTEYDLLQKLHQHRFYSNTSFSGYTECFRLNDDVLMAVQDIFINI